MSTDSQFDPDAFLNETVAGSNSTENIPVPIGEEPELEVDLELLDDKLLDPWFLRSEAEIALIPDDPSAQIHEIRIADYGTGFCDNRWAF